MTPFKASFIGWLKSQLDAGHAPTRDEVGRWMEQNLTPEARAALTVLVDGVPAFKRERPTLTLIQGGKP